MPFSTVAARSLLAAALFLSLSACETTPYQAEEPTQLELSLTADAKIPGGGEIASQLARVKDLTAPYHRFEEGEAAGWFAPLSECVSHPLLGGMGYHYGNPSFIDGSVDPLQPEVLLYEPQKNGRLRLVGVEYIVPVETAQQPDGTFEKPDHDPPTLFDQEFHWNAQLSLWALHVWIWRNNPEGMFADFNPKVTCDWAPEEE